MIDLEALKEQLKLLGHTLPEDQITNILRDMNIDFSMDAPSAATTSQATSSPEYGKPSYSPAPSYNERSYPPDQHGHADAYHTNSANLPAQHLSRSSDYAPMHSDLGPAVGVLGGSTEAVHDRCTFPAATYPTSPTNYPAADFETTSSRLDDAFARFDGISLRDDTELHSFTDNGVRSGAVPQNRGAELVSDVTPVESSASQHSFHAKPPLGLRARPAGPPCLPGHEYEYHGDDDEVLRHLSSSTDLAADLAADFVNACARPVSSLGASAGTSRRQPQQLAYATADTLFPSASAAARGSCSEAASLSSPPSYAQYGGRGSTNGMRELELLDAEAEQRLRRPGTAAAMRAPLRVGLWEDDLKAHDNATTHDGRHSIHEYAATQGAHAPLTTKASHQGSVGAVERFPCSAYGRATGNATDTSHRRRSSGGGSNVSGTTRPAKYEWHEHLRSTSPTATSVASSRRTSTESRVGGPSQNKKVDRVARYQELQKQWSKDKFLKSGVPTGNRMPTTTSATASRKPVNFHTHFAVLHAAAAAEKEHLLRTARTKTVPTTSYVVPTSKRRDALRWETRTRMQTQPDQDY